MYLTLAVLGILAYLKLKYSNVLNIIAETFKRDIKGATGYLRLNWYLWLWKKQNKTVESVFSSHAKKQPQKVAFLFEDDVWTFAQSEEYINRVARYFANQGFKKGDCIALVLENRPEYPLIWLGLSRIGVVTALINTNLVNQPLLHSIIISKAKSIIFGSNYYESINNILPNLEFDKLYQFQVDESKEIPNSINLREVLKDVSSAQLESKPELSCKDPLIYIYTSGTTGLPKAAIVTNIRFAFMGMGLYFMANLKHDDIVYGPLPLYHSAACIVGSCQAVLGGLTFVIRKKFSASNYWSDCARYKCTVAQYVGEVCRYVLMAHQNKPPPNHSVRAICGNGLRPQIWEEYVKKFKIQEVFEFYGATEGISNLINLDSKVGSVGFIPVYFQWLYPLRLIKYDESTGEPVRNTDGFCVRCKAQEPGLVLGPIDPKREIFNFKGYCDSKETKKKILQNVFTNGDAYFNSGDVLVGDEMGYYFFKDRLGDTFRWKGENVSTAEVEAVISNIVHLNDAVVYGVQIPNTEGRAGMAAVVDSDGKLDVRFLSDGFKQNLASYAIPVFVRVLKSVPKTGTYKLRKTELRSEGFDISKIEDNVYYYNSRLGQYEQLVPEIYEGILSGKLSL